MGRLSELAEQIAIGDRLTAGPMSKAALLDQIETAARDLRAMILRNPGCLSADEEYRVMRSRCDLESVARVGGTIAAFIDGTERAPMASVLQAAE